MRKQECPIHYNKFQEWKAMSSYLCFLKKHPTILLWKSKLSFLCDIYRHIDTIIIIKPLHTHQDGSVKQKLNGKVCENMQTLSQNESHWTMQQILNRNYKFAKGMRVQIPQLYTLAYLRQANLLQTISVFGHEFIRNAIKKADVESNHCQAARQCFWERIYQKRPEIWERRVQPLLGSHCWILYYSR